MAISELELHKAETLTGKQYKEKKCVVCGEGFLSTRPNASLCSNACKQQSYLARRKELLTPVQDGEAIEATKELHEELLKAKQLLNKK